MADLYYYETGYIDENYYVYTADAAANPTASTSLTVVIGVIKQSSISLETSFTTSTTISHIHGSDLFAFSDAALSIQVNLIKDTNISASSAFTISTDITRTRNNTSDESAEFTILAIGSRSRVFDLTSSAAFSLTASVVNVIQTSANLSSQFNIDEAKGHIKRNIIDWHIDIVFSQNVIGERLRSFDSVLASQSNIIAQSEKIINIESSLLSQGNLSIDVNKIRSVSCDLISQSTISCTISHIHGADLTAFINANLTALVVKNVGIICSASSASSVTANITGNKVTSVSLNSYSAFNINKYTGTGRPWLITANGYTTTGRAPFGSYCGTGIVETLNDNWSAIPKINQHWYFECFFSFSSYSNPSTNRIILTLGALTVTHMSDKSIKIDIIDSSNTTHTWQSNAAQANGRVENLTGVYHFAIVSTDTLNAYWGNTFGLTSSQLWSLRGGGANNSNFSWKKGTTNRLKFYNPTGWISRVDEIEFRIGDTHGISPADTTISQPLSARINDQTYTQGLWHLENNGNDDTAVNQSTSATLTSMATLIGQLSGPVRLDSTSLNASSTLTATCYRTQEIVLTAFTNASTFIVIDKIRSLNADLSSITIITTDANVIKLVSSSASSNFAQTIEYNRIRDAIISTQAIASELVASVVTIDNLATIQSTFNQTALGNIIASGQSTITSISSLTTDAIRSVDGNANILSNFTQQISIDRTRGLLSSSSLIASLFETTTRIRDFSLSISSQFNLNAQPGGLIEFIVLEAGEFTLVEFENRIRNNSSSISSQFNQNINTNTGTIRGLSSIQTSAFTQFTSASRTRNIEILTQAVASELIAIGFISGSSSLMSSTTTMSIIANKTAAITSTIDSTAIISATGFRTKPFAGTFNIQASLSAQGIFITEANLSVTISATLIANISRTTDIHLNSLSSGTLSLTAKRLRSITSNLNSQINVDALVNARRSALITTQAIASELVVAVKVIVGMADLSTTSTLTAVGKIIHITDNVYLIPIENRTYVIPEESRSRNIASETRIYKITRR